MDWMWNWGGECLLTPVGKPGDSMAAKYTGVMVGISAKL